MGFSSTSRGSAAHESGQAAVETALTMPLMLFMVLSVLQWGMLMQARNLAQYSVFRATRAGSVNHGNCEPMMHAAVATLIPSFVSFAGGITGGGSLGNKLGTAFRQVAPLSTPPYTARFSAALTRGYAGGGTLTGFTEPILWLVKERPTRGEISSLDLNNGEFSDWDQGHQQGGSAEPLRLEVRMVYWYPLRLPLVDWVLTRMVLAHWGLMPYAAQTPYAPTARATNWSANVRDPLAAQGPFWETQIKSELLRRTALKQYSFPILASYRMRMMTPPRLMHFNNALNTCGFP